MQRYIPAIVLSAGGLWTAAVLAQNPAVVVQAPARPTINVPADPLLREFRWRSIGPAGQGGRVDDIAVDERNPSTYYIGFAVSGVWKTINNGTTFEPIFDTYGVSSIGDLALAPSDPNILYVGTGEANNRQTSSVGNGLWKSTDAGAHFTNVGLRDSQSIARIVVHPKDPNVVWVAAAGHLYGPNAERGVFVTTDGGRSWTKTLFVDENTGATDLIVDPANPQNLWAAMYEHRRTPWGYVGGGPGSGLYQSTDAGKTWKRLTGNGLPRGTLGRIGLDITRSQPNVIYAQIEVALDKETRTPLEIAEANAPSAVLRGTRGAAEPTPGQAGRGATQPPNPQANGIWKSVDRGKTWQFASNQNQRPMYFSQIRVDPNDPNVVYVGGVNAQKSVDGGKTFVSVESHKGHVDNHAIWIDPSNGKHVMYGDDGGLEVTWDAGVTWEAVRLWPVGLAYHVSADLRHPYHVCVGLQDNGTWCGPSQTRSGGIHSWNWFNLGGGDGFQNQIDPSDPNVVYTESQNLGIQRFNLSAGQVASIKPNPPVATSPPAAESVGEGPTALPPQAFGGGRSNVTNVPAPTADLVSQFNWNAPLRLSHFDPSTLYAGGRQLFVSHDRGDSWTMSSNVGKKIDISQRRVLGVAYSLPPCHRDEAGGGNPRFANPGEPCILSKGDGHVANEFGTMTEISESPVERGVLWLGTDDGNVQLSRDAGTSFVEVGKNIPGVDHEYYVSGLEASWFEAGTAYVALDGHRKDDWKPYIFKTTDFGQTWQAIAGNLPEFGNVNSVRQDPVNRNLLYAATETGFFISLNDGATWSAFMAGLPAGRVDEVLVHPREHDLVLATHSRSVWILDDISPLESLPAELAGTVLLKPRDAVLWKPDRRNVVETPGDKLWTADAAPRGTPISYFTSMPLPDATLTIRNEAPDQPSFACSVDSPAGLQPGLHRVQWTLVSNQQLAGAARGRAGPGAGAPTPTSGPVGCSVLTSARGLAAASGRGNATTAIRPGTYTVALTVAGKEVGSQRLNVLEDVWLNER